MNGAADDRLAVAKELIQSARFDDAEAALLELTDQELESRLAAEAHYMLAVARRYMNDYDGALASIDDLLRVRPGYGRAYQEQGHALLGSNRPQQATRAFAAAVEANPGLIASWKALANLHERDGHRQQAGFAQAQLDYLAALPPELV